MPVGTSGCRHWFLLGHPDTPKGAAPFNVDSGLGSGERQDVQCGRVGAGDEIRCEVGYGTATACCFRTTCLLRVHIALEKHRMPVWPFFSLSCAVVCAGEGGVAR